MTRPSDQFSLRTRIANAIRTGREDELQLLRPLIHAIAHEKISPASLDGMTLQEALDAVRTANAGDVWRERDA